MARLQAGQLDASSAYRTQPRALGLPFLSLPKEINLGDASMEDTYNKATLTLNGKTSHPAPLVFYAAVLKGASQPALANRFVAWLQGPEAREILCCENRKFASLYRLFSGAEHKAKMRLRLAYFHAVRGRVVDPWETPAITTTTPSPPETSRRSRLVRSAWCGRLAMLAFTLVLLYPLLGLRAHVGAWQWNGSIPGSTASAVRTSLLLTALALLIDVLLGTPVACYLARPTGRDLIVWEAAVLISVLMPPLALGILLSLAFGPQTALGGWLLRIGVPTSNSSTAFAATQVYASIGYYVLAARAALAAVPLDLERTAALLGSSPLQVFRRVTFPLAKLGLAAALGLAWVRALGEFGAVVVTAYYPSGMPVQIWVNLQDAGMPAVMPLLVVFLLTALPLPWLIHLLAQKRTADA